jgi:hypothetical protein
VADVSNSGNLAMPARVQQFVRYWGFLVAKFIASAMILASLVWAVNWLWAGHAAAVVIKHHAVRDEKYLAYIVCMFTVYLIGVGLFYLSILDQRYRCRVCLRRLRMPIETGSWSKMLQFGRPHIQYICIYGHGKLNIPELHLTGMDVREWTGHSDYWAELCEIGARTSDHDE